MTTSEAKSFIGRRVKIRTKWRLESVHIIREVYNRNIITDSDSFYLSDIVRIEIFEKEKLNHIEK